MKTLISILAFALIAVSNPSFGHGDHDAPTSMNAEQVITIAERIVQKVTFKDLGFSAGKLPESWKAVSIKDYVIAEENEEYFVVSSHNAKTGNTIYFDINKLGAILDIRR